MQFNTFILLQFLSSFIAFLLAGLVWWRRKHFEAPVYSLFLSAIGIWAFGYGLELTNAAQESALFWIKVQYLGILTAPAFFLAAAGAFTHAGKFFRTYRVSILFLIPLATAVIILTNDAHHLFWRGFLTLDIGSFRILQYQRGPWWYVSIAYIYLSFFTGFALYLRHCIKSQRVQNAQSLTLVLAFLAPLVGNFFYVFLPAQFGYLDITPICFFLTALFLTFGFFRYRLLDILPVAWEAVVRGYKDGIIILDRLGRTMDVNAAAIGFLGLPSGRLAALRDIDHAFLKERLGIEIVPGKARACQSELCLGSAQWFEVTVMPVYEDTGVLSSQIITLHDATTRILDRREKERLIGELSGALENVKQLKGLIPICSSCKKIRNDTGYWEQVEVYIANHTDADFSHGLCPDCLESIYPSIEEAGE